MELDTRVLSPAWGWERGGGGWCVTAGDEEAGGAPRASHADGGGEGKLRHGAIGAQAALDSIPSPTASHHQQHPIANSIPSPMAAHGQQHPIASSIPSPTASHRQQHPITNGSPWPTASHCQQHPITSSISTPTASHCQQQPIANGLIHPSLKDTAALPRRCRSCTCSYLLYLRLSPLISA